MSEPEQNDELYERAAFNGKVIRRIFEQIRPHRVWLFLMILCIIVDSFLDGTEFYMMKRFVDEAIIPKNAEMIPPLLRTLIGIFATQCLSIFFAILISGLLGEKMIRDLRKKQFVHLQTLSLSYYSVTPVGWILSRVNQDTYRISDLVTWGVFDAAYGVVSILTGIYYMLKINVKLTLVVICFLPLLMWIAWQFRRRILDQFRIVRRFSSRITGAFNENISGAKVVKSFQREDKNLQNFRGLTGSMYQSAYRAAFLNALFLPAIQLITGLVLSGVVAYSGIRFRSGLLTVGGIQAFINYLTSMLWPIQDLARVYGEMQQSVASAERVFSLLDTQPTINDIPDPEPLQDLRQDIRFEHVDFYYDDEPDKDVLRDFSLTIHAGETIALVGETGGGKTTLVNLLSRFYEPKAGRILIGDKDYTRFRGQDIRAHIGIVLQTPHLFSGTIRENIRYGRLDATDAEIEAAAEMVGASDFISRMPQKFEEEVGENGNHLSVGQKQLISLARAVLTDPDVFIMDEATSSVDTETEDLLQRAMGRMISERTAVIIAHRLSTIRSADRIIVIEQGRIIEEGTHEALLKQRGPYYELYTRQFREEKEREYRI